MKKKVTVTELTKADIVNFKKDMIAKIKLLASDGGEKFSAVGNMSVIKELNWPSTNDNQLYWFIRNQLIEDGVLGKGKGKGGAVFLKTIAQRNAKKASDKDYAKELEKTIKAENDLYKPIAKVLSTNWIQDQNFRFGIAEVTAKQGARDTGGTWSRPDITVVSTRVFQHLPGKFLDVITFEVKHFKTIDLTSVYEALAHRRSSTISYIWLYCPECDDTKEGRFQMVLDSIKDEAEKHGIGVIIAKDAEDYGTWETVVEPERTETDPQRLDDFILNQISEASRKEIITNIK